jgi:uncharacterized protein (DUF305 family)
MRLETDAGEAAAVASPVGASPRDRSRRGLVVVAFTLVVGLILGAVGGLLYPRLTRPGDSSVEAGFLRDMSTHHAQAVEMSMIAHADSTDPDIVTLAGDIALTQQGQINYMQAWLRGWHLSPTSTQSAMAWMPGGSSEVVNGLMPGMATPQQLTTLRGATGKQLDVQYLQLMRQHHLGGIHMAQEAISLSKNKDVDWLAGTMVASQQGEINSINDMLKQLGAS